MASFIMKFASYELVPGNIQTALIAEHEAEVGKTLEPAFEINTRRHNGPLDAALTLKRFKRMAAEDGRAVL